MNKFKDNKIFELSKQLMNVISSVDFSISDTKNKKDDSVVTNVDYEVNNIIISLIKKIFGDNVPIISEEIEKDKQYIEYCLNSSLCFVIDPIDGTMALCSGINTFTISIGIMENGIITNGIIYLINKNEVLFTIDDKVYIMNKKIKTPKIFEQTTVTFKEGLKPISIASSLVRIGFNEKRPIFVINSSVFSMYNTFFGIFEKTICRTKIWDICACLAIGERLNCNFYCYNNNKKITCKNIKDFIILDDKEHMLSVGDLNVITYL